MKRMAVVMLVLALVASSATAQNVDPDLRAAIGRVDELERDYRPHRIFQWSMVGVAFALVAAGSLAADLDGDGADFNYTALGLGYGGAAVAGGVGLWSYVRHRDTRAEIESARVVVRQMMYEDRYADLPPKEQAAAQRNEIFIGMSEEGLRASWGGPNDINRTVTEHGEHKQYVYPGGRYVYVEDGKVTGWQD